MFTRPAHQVPFGSATSAFSPTSTTRRSDASQPRRWHTPYPAMPYPAVPTPSSLPQTSPRRTYTTVRHQEDSLLMRILKAILAPLAALIKLFTKR